MSDLNATKTPGYGFVTSGLKIADQSQHSFLYPYHSPQVASELIATASALVSPRGRGIYATDETPEGIEARLEAASEEIGLKKSKDLTDEEKTDRRRKWRKCLYEDLPKEHISGVILHSETLHTFSLCPVLTSQGIIPGIRADTDSHPLPSSPLEPATQGLDDLLPRLQRARHSGARFSKWRAPILLNASEYPTEAALEIQAESLARFAAISQQAGLVPIVEPDVDFAEDADLTRSVDIHVKIISMIYARCLKYGVLIEGSLIKPSFPQPGLKHPSRSSTTPEEVAQATASVLVRSVPIGVAGVVFLSGGLSDEIAAKYIRALNALVNSSQSSSSSTSSGSALAKLYARLPPLSFSFGRGLQGDALKKFVAGDEEGARKVFKQRAAVLYGCAKGE